MAALHGALVNAEKEVARMERSGSDLGMLLSYGS